MNAPDEKKTAAEPRCPKCGGRLQRENLDIEVNNDGIFIYHGRCGGAVGAIRYRRQNEIRNAGGQDHRPTDC